MMPIYIKVKIDPTVAVDFVAIVISQIYKQHTNL